ncbi:potassium transporter TrkA [candidate division KSB3 bacterium]|uniref:Potassium transporter TrkA n=1 Tax=candidate division KSB3 bacterium TaxID=2044937 RepID=A0A9D5Q6K8_9BACT|nr:potassium transporter TrkA [candidate division KSB3 bacterium]MBD3325347.1 potassium transporter TrkA [candidate division KSB3 bacterium]
MLGIVGVVTFLTILGLSLIITRLATIALQLTGLSHEVARFQGRTAFTGTGFTTSESEKVVNHPVRRRIIMLLMILRSAGFISIIISLILSFAQTTSEYSRLYRLFWVLGGVFVLWMLANSSRVDRFLNPIMKWALQRWTEVDTCDYVSLLDLAGDYTINRVEVEEGDWVTGKALRELSLDEEGVVLLGIDRYDGNYVGVPTGDTEIYPDDTLILYGRDTVLDELHRRRADIFGEQAHRKAVDEQQRQLAEQERQEQQHKQQRKEQEHA